MGPPSVYSLGDTDIKLRRNNRQFSECLYVFKHGLYLETWREVGWVIYHWQCGSLVGVGTCSSHNFIHFIHLHCCTEQNLSPSMCFILRLLPSLMLHTVHETGMESGRSHYVQLYAGFWIIEL